MESDHKALAETFASLGKKERKDILKEAERRRKAAQKRDQKRRGRRSKSYRAHQYDAATEKLGRDEGRGPASLHDWALRVLAEREAIQGRFAILPEGLKEGTVVRVGTRRCTVRSEGALSKCVLSSELAENQQTSLAVGDRVSFEVRDVGANIVRVVAERRTQLSRPDPINPMLERVSVANVDVVCIVASAKDPPFRPGLVDRYLIAIQRGGASPLLVVNKTDLIGEEERSALVLLVEPYNLLGLTVVFLSVETGEGIVALREALTDKLSAFVGHSGVGKSSIINVLDPKLDLETGETNQFVGRGRHTTTSSNLFQIEGGIGIVDTPGIRSFGMYQMEPRELRGYFPEFEAFAPTCRFSNCSHDHEPDCDVQQAVADGSLPSPRYDAYLRILRSLEDGES